MDTFKKKSLYAALAGLGALGATGAAQAVNVNPDGLGQALIYPYYTTRANSAGNVYNSLLSVVNSTSSAKAVKVRFLEGKNSREVLDFNLFLSAFDVWTTAIIPTAAGDGARIITADNSCILPNQIPAGGQAFVNFAYTGSSADGGGSDLDRTREGYVEIIEMATYHQSSQTWEDVTHDPPGGEPPCTQTEGQAAADALPPTGGLFGGITLINVNEGSAFTADAVALDNFFTVDPAVPAPQPTLYFPAGSIFPDFTFANNFDALGIPVPTSVVFVDNQVYQSRWSAAGGPNPVSAVLMHDAVLNEFVLDSITNSGTDWVVTFPTKRFYINRGTGLAPGTLFQRNFNNLAGSCDDISLTVFDREEQSISISEFSPPREDTFSLCWEANVITFDNSNVLASTNSSNVATAFENGWANLSFFDNTGAKHRLDNFDTTIVALSGIVTPTPRTVSYFGLPVVGFAVQTFDNGTLVVGGSNVQSTYGGNFVHKKTSFIFDFGGTSIPAAQ